MLRLFGGLAVLSLLEAICFWYSQRMNPACHKCGDSWKSRRLSFWSTEAICAVHGPFRASDPHPLEGVLAGRS